MVASSRYATLCSALFCLATADRTNPQTASAQSSLVVPSTIAAQLPRPWSRCVKLPSVEKVEARAFHEAEAIRGDWTVRQHARQIASRFYERTLVSRNKAAMLRGSTPRAGDALSVEAVVHHALELGIEQPGPGPLFPPISGRGRHIRQRTMHRHLHAALEQCKLPKSLTWYQCTRHTFASHWVMDGRPIEKLQQILGHSSVTVTERYAHLAPGLLSRPDCGAIEVDLSEPRVIPFKGREEAKSA